MVAVWPSYQMIKNVYHFCAHLQMILYLIERLCDALWHCTSNILTERKSSYASLEHMRIVVACPFNKSTKLSAGKQVYYASCSVHRRKYSSLPVTGYRNCIYKNIDVICFAYTMSPRKVAFVCRELVFSYT